MKKYFSFLLIINFLCMPIMPVFAADFDTSIDDDIRRNYNPSKIEQDMDLPALPKNLEAEETHSVPVNQYQSQYKTQTQMFQPVKKQPCYTSRVNVDGNYAVIKKGTKFRTKLMTGISDKTRKGSAVTLMTRYPVSTTYFTLPKGTLLQGKIEDSHPPLWTGNGGLIVIKVHSVVLNGGEQQLNAKVTEANFRNIFFNNIKGPRRYARSMFNDMRPGVDFYKRMIASTGRLLNDGGAAIWSPFPFVAGILGLGANVMVAPVIAIFSKGGAVYLRAGSDIEVKLTQDMIIYN